MEGARYRIGPLTTYAAPGDLKAWLEAAAPGDRCTYAVGPALSAAHETKVIAAGAAARGEAHLFQRRDGKGWRYLIEKRARPAEAADRRIRLCAGGSTTPEGRLYRVLAELARDGLPLPDFTTLAELADLPDRHAARYRLNVLERAGRVIVRGSGAAREIEIAGKGWVTRTRVKEGEAHG